MPRPHVARFVTALVRMDEGARHHIVPVPSGDADRFRAAKVRRLICTINGHALKRALQRHAESGDSFVILGGQILRDLGLKRGSRLTVELRRDPTPDALDIPEEFALVLAQDDAARSRWETFPVGRRRSLLYHVSGAKQEDTRIRRALEIAQKIRTHTLHGDRKR